MFKSNGFNKILLYYVCTRSISNMKNQFSINNILKFNNVGDTVKIQGWVKSVRKMKDTVFFDVSDGSCEKKLQVLTQDSLKPNKLFPGASIIASGFLNKSAKDQLELHANNIEIIGECDLDEGYPFAPRKLYAWEYIRQYLHLRSRTNNFGSMLRVRDAAMIAVHEHFHGEGYINVHTPILTSNDCEGAGEVFSVYPENKSVLENMTKSGVLPEHAYFDTKTFLTVSGQLHLEAIAHGLSKVYTLGPTFRAENSRSRLHLSEFYMLEAEIAFINKLEELVDIIELLIKNMTNSVLSKCNEDVIRCQGENKIDLSWVDKKFPIITYLEAVNILKKENNDFNEEKGFTKEDEILLVKLCGDIPTFVINWPKKDKPFYMKELNEDSTCVAALDLLAPNIGEIAGGSLREDDFDKLRKKLPHNDLDWYLELRKFGGVPTAGFGLGFERYLQFILGINSIKDVIPFPRWPHNCIL